MKTIFAQSVAGRHACLPPCPAKKASDFIPAGLLRAKKPALPEVSELDVVRHFTKLSQMNYSVDTNFYPLGSCTMKYNAKFMEYVAGLPGFTGLHPAMVQNEAGQKLAQGALEGVHEAERLLCEITGMKAYTLQPMAGAHGELTGVMLIAAYHANKGNKKTKIIIPDAAHGTNPASAVLGGYQVVNIESKNGIIDIDALKAAIDDDVAALMMTCPNTLGLFERNLKEIVPLLRSVDALLYYDGANMNAIMGKMRVGDVGFDVVHLNLHKTFGTPHGGGGPGVGAVGVGERLIPFLPAPRVAKRADGTYFLNDDLPLSIGYVSSFQGNYGVILKTLAYILRLGKEGIARASEYAVLNANYLRKRLEGHINIPYNRICMHEFVASADDGVSALNVAKALLERGYHAPTIYFPLIVHECLMFEPTETESKEMLDAFADDVIDILEKGKQDLASIEALPVSLPMRRLDETRAARSMVLTDDE